MAEVEMKIRGLMMDPVTNMPIVVLKDAGGSAILPIWVGIYEANAIALEIEKVSTPRPMTHDLIKTLLLGLDECGLSAGGLDRINEIMKQDVPDAATTDTLARTVGPIGFLGRELLPVLPGLLPR